MLQTILWMVFLVGFFDAAPANAKDYGMLSVQVHGIRQHAGEVGVALFNSQKGYPVHLEHSYETEWTPLQKGTTTLTFTFDGLPAGEYAVSVLHGENGNRKLERTMLGFPKEGVAFSNDQHVKLSAPKFDKCKFHLESGKTKQIAITLDYPKKP